MCSSDLGGTGDGNVGIGFAIPIDLVKQVAGQLMSSGKAQHAWMGVQLTDVDPTLASQVKIGTDRGAMVANVTSGSPAEKAGLRGATGETTIDGQTYAIGGDVIVRADDREINDVKDLQAVVASMKPGDELELEVKTADGSSRTVTVTLGDQPQDPSALAG